MKSETIEARMLRMLIEIDVARDAVDLLRRHEEREYMKARGLQFPSAAEYSKMNRYVDAVVLASEESRSVQAAIARLTQFKREEFGN